MNSSIINILLGAAAGFVSGLGLGGGAVLVPMLIFFGGYTQLGAQGANLIAYLPAAAMALVIHLRARRVDKALALRLCLSGLGGAALGTGLALSVSPEILRKGFGAFMIAMSVFQFIQGERKRKSADSQNNRRST